MEFNAQKLKETRTAAGETQQALADALNTSQNLVWQWEAGKITPATPSLVALCAHYRVGMDYFFE